MGQIQKSIGELDDILKHVKDHFLYSEQLENKVIKALNFDALSHSDDLEPDLDHQTTKRRLMNAWEFSIENYDGFIDERFIKLVSSIIDPINHSYRGVSGHITGIDGEVSLLTNPAKLDRDMGQLISNLTCSSHHSAFKAAEFGLYFVLVHPFADGNGRTARLLQNLYLFQNDIPPIIVPRTERVTYLRHIESAQIGFKNRERDNGMFQDRSFGEIRYLEYAIDKIKGSAERLSKNIANQKKYEIRLNLKGNRKRIYGVRDAIKDTLDAHNMVYQVNCSPSKGSMTLVTTAGEEYVIGIMEKCKRSPNLKSYKLERTG